MLWSKAAVTKRGAVLLGKYVACDGFSEARPLRVVTHAHSDHLLGLRSSLKRCEAVIMTPATRDLINVIENPFSLAGENVKTHEYEEPFEYKTEKNNAPLFGSHSWCSTGFRRR